MYSEHLIALLLRSTRGYYPTGADMDQDRSRHVVQIGGIIGSYIGSNPSDGHLAWWAQKVGTPTSPMTRGAIHVLAGPRIGVGLGPSRGVIESCGDHLCVVRAPEPDRYLGAYLLPTIQYGGLR